MRPAVRLLGLAVLLALGLPLRPAAAAELEIVNGSTTRRLELTDAVLEECTRESH